MQIKKMITIFSFFMLLTSNNLEAGANDYITGLGRIIYFTQADYLGRGGTSLAIIDRNRIPTVNPAGLIFIDLTRISGDFYHESIDTKYEGGTAISHYSNLHGVELAVPLVRNKFVVSLNLKPIIKNDFQEQAIGELSTGNQYKKQIINNGGINQVSLGMASGFKNRVFVGLFFNLNFGRIEENWKVDFVSDLYEDTSDKIVTSLYGGNFTAGMMVQVLSNLYLGATYAHHADLQGERYFQYAFNIKSEKSDVDVEMPNSWGVGLSYVLQDRVRFSTDFFTMPWSKLKMDEYGANDYNNEYHFSTGVELLPSTKLYPRFFQRIKYQVGFHYSKLGIENVQSEIIQEYLGTVGVGIPFYGGYGRIDLSCGFGKCSSQDQYNDEESLLKFMVTVSGGERWFVRPR